MARTNNGNLIGRAARGSAYDDLVLISPRDDVINELKELIGKDWFNFYDDLYKRFRHKDTKRYERILRNILSLYQDYLLYLEGIPLDKMCQVQQKIWFQNVEEVPFE